MAVRCEQDVPREKHGKGHGMFARSGVPVNHEGVFKNNGAVIDAFRPEYPVEGQPPVDGQITQDVGDVSGRGRGRFYKGVAPRMPGSNFSRTAVITPVKEDFPRNA